jgi:hypothetical protein
VGACPNGAVPGPNAPATGWIWVGLAGYLGSKLPEWLRIIPWLGGALGNQLVNVGTLCSSNPDPPAPITPQDFLLGGIIPQAGPLIAPAVFGKIWQNVLYDAFQQWCVCNATAGCQTVDIDLTLGQNLEYNTHFPGYGWPTTKPGVNSDSDWNYDYYPWPTDCASVDIEFWQLPYTGTQIAHNPVRVNDCGGIIYSQSWNENNPFNVTIRNTGTGVHCPGIHVAWAYNVTPTNYPNWHIRIGPHAGTVTPPVIPSPPPDQTGPVPTAPPLKCDSTTLCSIYWNIQNQVNVGINFQNDNTTTILSNNPTDYAVGQSWTVSGTGVQLVAQGTLGVAIEFASIPPTLTPTPTDPPRYYDVGWIALGAADALEQKRWIHSTGERFMPVFPEFDRVHYNLTDGVEVTIVELVPVSSSS